MFSWITSRLGSQPCSSFVVVQQSPNRNPGKRSMNQFTSKSLFGLSFIQISSKITRYSIDESYFFNADALVRDLCGPFILSFCQSVVLHGFSFLQIEGTLLNASLFLGKHASIIRISPAGNRMLQEVVMTYIHPTQKPAGINFPIQCQKCGMLRKLKISSNSFQEVTFSCTAGGCTNIVHNRFPFPVEGFQSVKGTSDMVGGEWMHRISELRI